MKKKGAIVLMLLLAAFAVYANGANENGDGTFTPNRDVTWTVTSSPGGGSDIFTQEIKNIMIEQGITDANLVIDYVTDGGGEIGRLNVSRTQAGPRADHTLLTFNSGDLMPMCLNTDRRLQDFTPIALMAIDNHLLLCGQNSPYDDWQKIVDALDAGKRIVIGGSKGDDIETYKELLKELGVEEEQLAYITYDATSGAITALLGGHVDIVLGKPASCEQYILAERIFPVVGLSEERFTSDILKDMPTITEYGYNPVDVPNWRGVAGPKEMSEAAADYWSECLRQVSETEDWKVNYLERNSLIPMYLDREQTYEYMNQFQVDFLKKIGKDA